MIWMPISEKQKMILAFPYTKKYQSLICDGAVRTGKTSIMTIAFIDWAMREFDQTNFAICGKTVGSAIKNIVVPYMALSYAKKRYRLHFTRSDNKLVVSRGRRKNVFYIYGGKDESSYMLIQGITLAGVLFDEVALMTRSFVEQALARCLSHKDRRYFFNCNPGPPNHWFYVEWIKEHEKHRALHLHFLMPDNPILDADTIREAEAMYSGVFYQRYVLGEWVQAEGLIYRQFADNPARYTISPMEVPHLMEINAAFDPGGTRSAHAFVATGITPRHEQLVALRSERHDAKDTTPKDVDRMAVEFVGEIIRQYGRCDYLYWDNEAQVLGRGIKVAVEAAYPQVSVRPCYKGQIIDRIHLISRLMGQDRFKLTTDCATLREALEQALWDEDHDDERLDDGTTPIDDLDALEYTFSNQMARFFD